MRTVRKQAVIFLREVPGQAEAILILNDPPVVSFTIIN